jgi:hypothetical protein
MPQPCRPASGKRSTSTIEVAEADLSARGIIEDMDSAQFGGPSFGSQTIVLMSLALEEALAILPQPVEDESIGAIVANILKAAAEGERDPVRPRLAAMLALNLDEGPAIETPLA